MSLALLVLALLIDLVGVYAGFSLLTEGPNTHLTTAIGVVLMLVFTGIVAMLVLAFLRKRRGAPPPPAGLFRFLAYLPAAMMLVGSFDRGILSGQEVALVLAVAAVGWLNMRAYRA